MSTRKPNHFEISISGRDDGTIETVYVVFSSGRVARTEEVIEDVLLADYNTRGGLVGMEILAPVRVQELIRLVDRPMRRPFGKFIRHAAPESFICAS